MGRTSSAVKDKYNAKVYDEIKVRVSKGQKDTIQAHAQAQGESVNGFIGRAISEAMKRDGSSPMAPTQASPQAPETPQDEPLVLVEIGYDPIAGKPLYREKNTGKQYTVEAIPISGEVSEDITDDLPF